MWRIRMNAQIVKIEPRRLAITADFKHLRWGVGPGEEAEDLDWIFAFKLKRDQLGEPEFAEDDWPGLSYSARSGAIDFDAPRAQVASWAGEVWDFSRRVGLPEAYARISPP